MSEIVFKDLRLEHLVKKNLKHSYISIDKSGNIKELGKKPNSYDHIEGQYIGLIKIKKDVTKQIKEFYKNLDKAILYDGKDYNNMYMTSFLQMIADNLIPLTPVYIKNGWMEVDEPSDLDTKLYKKYVVGE